MCLFHVRINKFVLRAQSCRFACNSQAQARCPGACALDAAMVNAFDVGAIYVPREEDDGRERAYAQWTGPCPCADTCSSGSWNRVKSKLWTYDDQNEVVKLVVHHLTHSANHMMTDEEAHATVIAHLEAYPESMTQGTEDFDQREAYRRWTGAIRGGGTTASAAKAATNDYLSSLEQLEQPPPMTTMMTEAMAQVEALNEDDMKGVRDAASAVALLTNNDVDLGLGVRALVPRRGAKRPVSSLSTGVGGLTTPPMPAGPPPAKQSKGVKVSFDMTEIKTLAHVLMNAKTQTKSIATYAQQMHNNFASAHALICQCQADLSKVMATALERHKRMGVSSSSSASAVRRR